MTYKVEWDLTSLYAGIDDPKIKEDEQIITKKITDFVQKWTKDQSYLENIESLREALDEYDEIRQDFYWGIKSMVYFWLLNVTTQDKTIKSLLNKAEALSTKLSNMLQFFELTLGKISGENQEKFLADQQLRPYYQFLKDIFDQSRYFLSDKEEALINSLTKTSYQNWIDMIKDFLASEKVFVVNEQGEKEEKSYSQLHSLLSSSNKNIRDDAALHINNVLEKYVDVAEIELNSVLEYRKVLDEMRGYNRPDQSRHLNDGVSSTVVDALIEATVSSNPMVHRYYEIRANLAGQNILAYHERYMPLGAKESIMKFSFDEAVALVKKVLMSLDDEFVSIFDMMLTSGAIDVYPKAGKQNGAFNAGVGKNIGNFVMLNFNGKVRDITTLAHEMGHAFHTQLTGNYQNAINYGYGMFAAEVASTFVEGFVFDELMQEASKEEKFFLMFEQLGEIIATIHRQIACYRFEQDIHAEYRATGLVSKEKLGELFQKNMSDYMGPYVEQSPGSENWWVYRGHIRRYFYVYTYSSGLLIAKALQKRVKQDKSFVAHIKKHFLSAGRSRTPEQMFAAMGVDITNPSFWKDGLDEVNTMLEETIALGQELGYL